MLRFAAIAFVCLVGFAAAEEPKKPLRILFLGDKGHHQPAARFRDLQQGFTGRGIDFAYYFVTHCDGLAYMPEEGFYDEKGPYLPID